MKPRAIALLLIPILAGCTGLPSLRSTSGAPAPASAATTAATTLTIYGAASLKAVLAAIKTAYEGDHPGTSLTISTDSSSALEAKIELGARADVFLSADTTNPQKLVAAGLAPGGVTKFAGNLLTVVVPGSNPAGIQSPADLARPGLKIVAAGDAVPITKYATQLVANLARQPGYPADFGAAYTRNVVSKEDNVAAVVAKVVLRRSAAAWSGANPEREVDVLLLPE